jgi:alkanesulfonate monooxygenase SsuD/methylene tetrahydromethanopterin reductase-like flavin-dependent oxidoreductase (luciferase family)
MDFGVVLQTNPSAWRVVELARQAELYGFTHVWTFDSHLLWQEPYVIYSQILSTTHRVTVGPMVTNPATRDWTVTASIFATLNDMFGNRTICGIGRGDSAVRVTNGRPATLATLRESIDVIRGLGNSETVDYKGNQLRLPWSHGSQRWFGGMVGNHVAEIVNRYGADGAAIPTALSDYIAGRTAYDYNTHGRAGNVHTEFVPDEVVDRFCIIGPPTHHVARLQELAALGVDQFAIYLQHDAKEATLAAYGEEIISAVNPAATART